MFFINSAIWYHAIWSHNHEIANLLSSKWKVYWIDPIKVKWYPHFEKINSDINLNNVKLINANLFAKKLWFFYLVRSECQSFVKLIRLKKQVNYFISYWPIWNFGAFLLAKFLWKKIISFYVDDYIALSIDRKVKILYSILLPIWFKVSDMVISTAKTLEQDASKHNKHTFYFPNWVNLSKLKIHKPIKFKKLWSIWFVGSLWNWVDWEIIIKLAKRYKSIKFEIVWDWEIWTYLKENKLKFKLNNLNLHWFKPHNDALKIIKEVDITIIPFHVNEITNAVSPVKLFEYWSLGKTSIVSNTYELQQFNEELFIYNNDESLFTIIDWISHNTKKCYKKSQLSADKLEKFNWWGYLGKRILDII